MNDQQFYQRKKWSPSKDKWLNVKQLAEYLGTTATGIRNMVYRGKLPAYKPFGKLLFDKREIDSIVRRHEVE